MSGRRRSAGEWWWMANSKPWSRPLINARQAAMDVADLPHFQQQLRSSRGGGCLTDSWRARQRPSLTLSSPTMWMSNGESEQCGDQPLGRKAWSICDQVTHSVREWATMRQSVWWSGQGWGQGWCCFKPLLNPPSNACPGCQSRHQCRCQQSARGAAAALWQAACMLSGG
jgi:hypothetical protein